MFDTFDIVILLRHRRFDDSLYYIAIFSFEQNSATLTVTSEWSLQIEFIQSARQKVRLMVCGKTPYSHHTSSKIYDHTFSTTYLLILINPKCVV